MRKVLCWGTFDRLHKGHIEFLKDAKSKGNYLIIIIISDKAVYENKKKLPKDNQKQRAKKLKDLSIVDEVILASEDLELNFNLIYSVNPDLFVFGHDQQTSIEEKLKNYFEKRDSKLNYYISKEFADGIHTSNL